jgi:restriction system protein
MAQTDIPTFDKLMNPVIQALKQLGGSGTIEEINSKVIEIAKLSDEQLELLHDPRKGSQTEVEYRLAWARTYLKKYGVVENSSRGVWALTASGRQLDQVNPQVVRRSVQSQRKKVEVAISDRDELDEADIETSWRDELLATLLRMEPAV